MNDMPIKETLLDDDIKKKRKIRMRTCPFCGNASGVNVFNGIAFCKACHKRMPWKVMKTDDPPIKETV